MKLFGETKDEAFLMKDSFVYLYSFVYLSI